MLNATTMSVIMLHIIMQNVIILNVVMLSVVAPVIKVRNNGCRKLKIPRI
jgi:hypothetical protein